MSLATRSLGLTRDVVRELGMVVPRTVAGLNESTGWAPATPRGVRQFGEVMLDELVLSGFSLLDRGPAAVRPLSECAAAAEELSALGIDRRARRPATPASKRDTTAAHRRAGVRADDVRTRSGATEDTGSRWPGWPGPGGGVPAAAPRWPEAVADMGTRRRSGTPRRHVAIADRTAYTTGWGSTLRCRCSPGTVLDAAIGRRIRT